MGAKLPACAVAAKLRPTIALRKRGDFIAIILKFRV
jgi:hypothetical protein